MAGITETVAPLLVSMTRAGQQKDRAHLARRILDEVRRLEDAVERAQKAVQSVRDMGIEVVYPDGADDLLTLEKEAQS